MIVKKDKKKLTLSVDSEIVDKAKELEINISEITEKVLRAFTATSKTGDKEKLYDGYQELFKLMLPLLKKFQVRTPVAQEVIYGPDEDLEPEDFDPNGEPILPEPEPLEIFTISLDPDGKLYHDEFDEMKIKDIPIEDFLRPQEIVDEFLIAIKKGILYRRNQFSEIEMAKKIIDAITKPILSKRKRK